MTACATQARYFGLSALKNDGNASSCRLSGSYSLSYSDYPRTHAATSEASTSRVTACVAAYFPRSSIRCTVGRSDVVWLDRTGFTPTLDHGRCTFNDNCGAKVAGLDQYYTKLEIAAWLYAIFKGHFIPTAFRMVEPGAGTGAFLSLLPPGSLGIDLDPKFPGIKRADFLRVDLRQRISGLQPIAVIGNPPFGRTAGMAIRFFNHAARWSDVIAFILPRSIRKPSVENRLAREFHLVREVLLPEGSFIFEDETYDVPAVFQIWERRSYLRDKRSVERTHPDFVFTTYEEADFAIRRIGMRAGLVCDKAGAAASSHYFIKGPVRAAMEMLDFSIVTEDVAGPRSLSKSEIVALYCKWRNRMNLHRSKVSGRYAWQRRGRFRSFQRAVSMR